MFHVEEYAVIVSVVKEVHLMPGKKRAIIFRYLQLKVRGWKSLNAAFIMTC